MFEEQNLAPRCVQLGNRDQGDLLCTDQQLKELVAELPENSLYANELSKIEVSVAPMR